MNWTGGRLQQASKGGGNRLVARQKQHLAKARTKLQNGHHRSSPFRPSFWESNELQDDLVIPRKNHEASSPLKYHSESQQKTLYDYEATAPVARQLASLTPVPSKSRRKRSSKACEHDTIQKDAPKITTGTRPIERARLDGPRMIAVSQVARSADLHSRRYSIPDSENPVKRRRVTAVGEDDLESERQKLLNQPDWMRLKPGRPLKIHFPPTSEKERIGKRRKLSSRHNADTKVPNDKRVVSPFQIGRNRRGPHMTGALQRHEDIKIRIGPDALLSQMSSRWSQAEPRREESSDTMLLDGGWTTSQPYENKVGFRQADSLPASMLARTDEPGESNFHLLPDSTPSEASIPDSGHRKSRAPMAHRHMVHSTQMLASDMNKPTRNPTQQRPRNLRLQSYPEAPSGSVRETPAAHQSPGPSLKRPVRLIFPSSSPVRQDLQPVRSDRTLIEFGEYVPTTVQDNGEDVWNGFEEPVNGDEDWRKFLDIPEEEDTATRAFLDESKVGEDNGQSNAQDDAGGWQSSNTYIDPAGSEHQVGNFEDVNGNDDRMVDATSSEFMGFSLTSEVSLPDDDQQSRSESLKRLESLAARNSEAPVEQCIETKKAGPDADELWNSFVFGDDEDSDIAIDDMLDAGRTQTAAKFAETSDENLNTSTRAVCGNSSSPVIPRNPLPQHRADGRASSLPGVHQSNMHLSSSSPDRIAMNASDSSLRTLQTQTAFSMYNNVSSAEASAVADTLDTVNGVAVNQSRFFPPPPQTSQNRGVLSSSMQNNVSLSSDELSSANPAFTVGQSSTARWPPNAAPKVLFSKPTPFRGTRADGSQKVIHLGRTAPRHFKGKGTQPYKREIGRLSPSIYDFPQSGPDDEEEGDSIQDD